MIYSTTSENVVEGTRYASDAEAAEWMRRVFGAGYVTPEQRRERDIDAAVREAMTENSLTVEETWNHVRPPATVGGMWLKSDIGRIWREQHA